VLALLEIYDAVVTMRTACPGIQHLHISYTVYICVSFLPE